MSAPDYRLSNYDLDAMINCGRFIGNTKYYKLFVIENILRVVIFTLLKSQVTFNDWWDEAVDNSFKKNWFVNTNHHGIHHLYLSQLNSVLNTNRDYIEKYIPDFDELLLNIEEVNHPRNKIAHMKYPNSNDTIVIDNLYNKCKKLAKVVNDVVTLEIPH